MTHADPGPVGTLRIAPSILSADFAELGAQVRAVDAEADWFHLDVMDSHFVPNLTIGPAVVSSLRPHTTKFFDCHLMVENPLTIIPAFRAAGMDGCTIHVELGPVVTLLAQMRELGLRVGLAVNPETPFREVQRYLDQIDLLLVMSVHPGFAGQSFIPDVLDKVRQARTLIDRVGLPVDIEIDGGVDPTTVRECVEAGANVLVAGNAIFAQPDPLVAARALREAARAEG